MITISVCMIVKNEQQTLAKILECAKNFADEIIVVDTGSTDNTKQIAKIYTNKVYDFVWCDDFSKARNFSFSKATCDYQMWLDADDYISQSEINKIIDLKHKDKHSDVYMFKYAIAFDENGSPTFEYYRERLLRRSINFKWQGFIHEAISPSGKISYQDITIIHKKEKTSDPTRNLTIFENAIKNNICLSTRELYYYARELFYNHQYFKCIQTLKNYLDQNDTFTPNIQGAYILLSQCYVLENNIEFAKHCLFECIKKFEPTPEICFNLANIYQNLNDTNQAIFWNRCAIMAKENTLGFVQKQYKTLFPYLELTKLYFSIGEPLTAYTYHKLAEKTNPKHPSVIFNKDFFERYFSINKQ